MTDNKPYLIAGYYLDHATNLVITSAFTERELAKINTDNWEPLEAGVVIGTVTEWFKPCIMSVGNGKMVHDGYTTEYVIDAEGVRQIDGRWIEELKSGPKSTEPRNGCGANAYHRFGGYAGFTRNGNRRYPDGTPVTCSKCLKRAAKGA